MSDKAELMNRRATVVYQLAQWEETPTNSPERSNERTLNIMRLSDELKEIDRKLQEADA